MKKFILAPLLFLSLPLFAFYTGNPASPALLQGNLLTSPCFFVNFTTGYLYDQVWDRDLHSKDVPDFSSLQKIGNFEMRANLATIALIFLRRLEIYGNFGVSKENIDWNSRVPFASTEIQTKNHFSYSVGAKAIMLQFGATVLSLDLQYFTLPSSNKVMQKIVNIYMPLEINAQYLIVKEWQLAGGLATKLGPLCPYLGVKYAKMGLNVASDGNFPDLLFQNKQPWGMFIGISLNISHLLFLTGEMRFFDEKAFSIAVTTSF